MDRQNLKRILILPDSGNLLVAGDIHGNMRDFQQLVNLFRRRYARNKKTVLLFLGDLIHGPSNEAELSWPRQLGNFYQDGSVALLDAFHSLRARYPQNVFSLLGNHDHSHIGGPHTGKFHENETLFLESLLSEKQLRQMKALFASFPLIAISPSGLVFSHASPSPAFESLDEIEASSYEGYEEHTIRGMLDSGFVGQILWRRYADNKDVQRYLARTALADESNTVAVFSHDVIEEGFARIGSNQLCVSTSFGLRDEHKCFLDLDLSLRYPSTADIRPGYEIRRLWKT